MTFGDLDFASEFLLVCHITGSILLRSKEAVVCTRSALTQESGLHLSIQPFYILGEVEVLLDIER